MQIPCYMHQSVSLQILVLTKPMTAYLAHERRLVPMRCQMRTQILFTTRFVRALRHRASIGGTGVPELMGSQCLQVGSAKAAFVAKELRMCGMRETMIVQTMLPFEALVAVAALMRGDRRVFGRV